MSWITFFVPVLKFCLFVYSFLTQCCVVSWLFHPKMKRRHFNVFTLKKIYGNDFQITTNDPTEVSTFYFVETRASFRNVLINALGEHPVQMHTGLRHLRSTCRFKGSKLSFTAEYRTIDTFTHVHWIVSE